MRNWHGLRAFAILAAACNPATTRPDFRPLPQAPTVLLSAQPNRVIPVLAALVVSESLRVRRMSPEDGYLETDWYDTRTRRSFGNGDEVPDLASVVKLRCWADPYVPSETILTIEPTYRPRYDPSRVERDLEALAPQDHDGYTLAQGLLRDLKERFGSPKPVP